MNLVYSLLYLSALAFVLPREYLKRPANLRPKWLRQKFGLSPKFADKKTILIHAVSVGETLASVSLVRQIHLKYPDVNLCISTVTDTGSSIASSRLSDIAQVVYIPFDLPFCINRFFDAINPSVVLIMETELWPNLIDCAYRREIPVILLNGRISEKSFLRYCKVKKLLHPTLSKISHFCLQDELYKQRFAKLGVPYEKITITGNLKFDISSNCTPPKWAKLIKGKTIIAGSTHHPEESLILEAYLRLKQYDPELNLIIAPRHPERFDEVWQLIEQSGEKSCRVSELSQDANYYSGAVVLLDVMGELMSAYAVSDIAIIGGSFINHGGQNPLEPAICGKAVICGPNMQNFPFITDFYAQGAALKTTAETLYETLKDLLANPSKASDIGIKAKTLTQSNSGAGKRTMEVLQKFI